MKFASKVGKGIFPKNDPLYNHILRRRRRLLQRFNARKNLCRTIKLSRAWIPWRSSTPLSERHPGIFLSGCDNRTILAKHVTSFAPVAQHHLFGEKDIPLDIAMERNFPWQYRWISSRGEDSNMSFPVSDGSIKFVSTFEYRHYLSKVGEGKSHRLVANELRKEDGHKDRFSPISERTNSFPKIKTDFWIAKTALDLCTLKFLLRRFWSKDQNKLWRRNFVQSTYLWLPKIPEYGKYPILQSFFGLPCEHTKWPSNDFFLIWAECDSSKDLCQFASFSNQRSLAQDSPQEPEHNLPPKW